jgi:hypothetical protein
VLVKDEIPAAILMKHPELSSVAQALDEHRRGAPITAACMKCGHTLSVSVVAVTGATVVACPEGHTSYRSKQLKEDDVLSDTEIQTYLGLYPEPLDGIAGDEHWWRIGPLAISKKEAIFRAGFGAPIVPSTRFVLQQFRVDALERCAVLMLSGGKPATYFAGWVPATRVNDARTWIATLNDAIQTVSKIAVAGARHADDQDIETIGSRLAARARQMIRSDASRSRYTPTGILNTNDVVVTPATSSSAASILLDSNKSLNGFARRARYHARRRGSHQGRQWCASRRYLRARVCRSAISKRCAPNATAMSCMS